jgi:hypothetical protein
VTDLSTRDGEFKEHLFPLNIVFDSIALDEWKDDGVITESGGYEIVEI